MDTKADAALFSLVDKLCENHSLTLSQYQELIVGQTPELSQYAAEKADNIRKKIYSNHVYIRGLIEVSNVCRNDCYYCGIRKSNKNCQRYTLTKEQILECCEEGYTLGFRTFVMQGGEGIFQANKVCDIVSEIKLKFPDCAVTLSLGEYSTEEYEQMYKAGANRYLLRHETADKAHYEMLHPKELSFDNRMRCLYDLKRIGFQAGCGVMVGSPFQTPLNLAKVLKFIEEFSPDMCGIGPFMPQKDTPFGKEKAGTAAQTIFLLSLIRIIKPNILLPATTALGSIQKNGRELGIMAGANVIMPNLSPYSERKKYSLYDNKLSSGKESAQNLNELKASMEAIGYEIVVTQGNIIK